MAVQRSESYLTNELDEIEYQVEATGAITGQFHTSVCLLKAVAALVKNQLCALNDPYRRL